MSDERNVGSPDLWRIIGSLETKVALLEKQVVGHQTRFWGLILGLLGLSLSNYLDLLTKILSGT